MPRPVPIEPASRRPRGPLLLALVFGVFLAIVGITATMQAILVSAHFSSSTVSATAARDRAVVRLFVDGNLAPSDLAIEEASLDRVRLLERQLATLVERDEILRLEVRDVQGRVVLSDVPAARGLVGARSAAFERAVSGQAWAGIVEDAAAAEAVSPRLPATPVLQEYLPLVGRDGNVRAVVALWRDAEPVLATLADTRRDIILVTLIASLVLALVLLRVFRAAQGRIREQTRELVEATRRDAFTGLLNHGSLVEVLGQEIEAARASGGAVTVGLIDIDNFGLLNETHGHAEADRALLAVARLVEAVAPSGTIVGRFGPDEFLVIGPPKAAVQVEPSVVSLRHRLVDLSLQFQGTERLPVTVSAGVCSFPVDAPSVTELLSVATTAVTRAKASGGDAIHVIGVDGTARTDVAMFDVLQGLVFAIDTKDRYTKRHSEDVARYAAFIADRVGVEPELRRTIVRAGLLHDVGKIGIPDRLLRKPGQLTPDEQAVFRQHVALGGQIVQGLPDIELVRAGIRHHHERWDGQGYLDGLAGETIPLIARILAVADAFSAMTTSRNYRKALSVEEALKRLRDAAGSQLDERLVAAFIQGLETAPDAPIPGSDWNPAQLWLPTRAVA